MESNVLTFGYIGTVTVKLVIKDKIINLKSHNKGLIGLSKAFAKIMSGNYQGIADIPQYLDIRVPDGSGEDKTFLNAQIPISGAKYSYKSASGTSDPNWVADLTATVTNSNLIDVPNESVNYKLILYSGLDRNQDASEPYHDLAELEISGSDLAKITPGTQAIINWAMELKSLD